MPHESAPDGLTPDQRKAWNAANSRLIRDAEAVAAQTPLNGPVFERGGEVEIGQHLARELGPQGDVIGAENRVWQYRDGVWTRWEDAELERKAAEYDGAWVRVPRPGEPDKFRPVTLSAGNVRGIVSRCKVHIASSAFFADAPVGVPFRSHFARIVGKSVQIEPLTRSHRVKSEHASPFDLPAAESRPWTTELLLAQTWAGCDDIEQRIQYFWEWLGAALAGIATRYKDTPLLTGPKDTGKSQILHAISVCFPPTSHRSVTLHAMSSDYHRAHLSGGRINFVNELPARELLDGEAAKSILSGQAVGCRRPCENPFDWVPRCAHVFAANEMPPSRDTALMERFVVLNCANVVPPEAQDRDLANKLTNEAPLIAAAALAALPALLARGHLIRPGSAADASADWRKSNDVVLAWSGESLMMVNDFVTQGSALYAHFTQWLKENGHRQIASNVFATRLKSIGFTSERKGVVRWNAEIKSDARRSADAVWGGNNRYGTD